MDKTHRDQLAADFSKTITASGDTVLKAHDRIEHWARQKPELVARCKFGRSMQVRRLKMISPRYWNPADWHGAEAILVEVESLKRAEQGPESALALAVLGVEVDALPAALALLENHVEPAVSVEAVDPKPRPPERQSGQKRKA